MSTPPSSPSSVPYLQTVHALTVGRRFRFCSSSIIESFGEAGDGNPTEHSGGEENSAEATAVCRVSREGNRVPLLEPLPMMGDETGWYSDPESRPSCGLSCLTLSLPWQESLCRRTSGRLFVSRDVRFRSQMFVLWVTPAYVEGLQPSTLIGRSMDDVIMLPESKTVNC